jgi:hypothetical protein
VTDLFLGMGKLLKSVKDGRFASEYCQLMATELALVHPETAAQLQLEVQKSGQVCQVQTAVESLFVRMIHKTSRILSSKRMILL